MGYRTDLLAIIFFLAVGGIAFLVGGDIGGFAVYVFALALLFYGARNVKGAKSNGKKFIALIALISGLMLVANWLPFLIGLWLKLLFLIIFIYLGWKWFKTEKEERSLDKDDPLKNELMKTIKTKG